MAMYRFYRLDRDQHIYSHEKLDLKTDGDALMSAMEMAGEFAIEVWDGCRMVTYIAEAPWPIRGDIERMRESGVTLHP